MSGAADVAVWGRALELCPDGLVGFDRACTVCLVSAAFTDLTGLQQPSLLGQPEDAFWDALAALENPQHTDAGVAALRRHLQQPNEKRRSVLELLRPEPRMLKVEQRSADDAALARLLCFRDVTREVDIARRKSEFISTAAHELRAPLASIYGFSEALQTHVCDAATQSEFIGIIHQQAQAMAALLDEMLDLARIEARRQTDFVFERVDALELIRQTLQSFRPVTGREPPTLHPVSQPLFISVDRRKLRQVLINVLSNAYKYSPEGGAVDISVGVSPSDSAGADVMISVRDHGIGMTADQLARVFDRFYRAHAAPGVKGAGLGMAIVQELMTLLNGRVEVHSVAGSGTCVDLFFPRA